MLSRIAENLYWLGRYIERTENTARLFNVQANLMLDLPKPYRFAWRSLIDITGSNESFFAKHEEADAANVQAFLLNDTSHGGSLASSLRAARENLRASRDGMPKEAWENFNEFYQNISKRLGGSMANSQRFELLEDIIAGCQQLLGLIAGTMDRNEGFYFMRLGRNLERADMTARIIDVRSANLLKKTDDELAPYDSIQWMSVLKSLSGYQSYRSNVQAVVSGREVLQFLIQNPVFPRSVKQCVDVVETAVKRLPKYEKVSSAIAPLHALLEDAPISDLIKDNSQLNNYVDDIEQELMSVHVAVAETWFSTSH